MSIDFALLADGAAVNKVLDEGRETGPPEVLLEDRFCTENAHIIHSRRGMNQVKKGGVG